MAKQPMSHDDARAALDSVRKAMHDQFSDNTARLEQFDAHLATTQMCVDHLYDEADRH